MSEDALQKSDDSRFKNPNFNPIEQVPFKGGYCSQHRAVFIAKTCPKCDEDRRLEEFRKRNDAKLSVADKTMVLKGLTTSNDETNHPSHYNAGTMEVIEAIEGLQLDFSEGNALKYLARWKYKGGVTDLKKAAWYVQRVIYQTDPMQLVPLVRSLLENAISADGGSACFASPEEYERAKQALELISMPTEASKTPNNP